MSQYSKPLTPSDGKAPAKSARCYACTEFVTQIAGTAEDPAEEPREKARLVVDEFRIVFEFELFHDRECDALRT